MQMRKALCFATALLLLAQHAGEAQARSAGHVNQYGGKIGGAPTGAAGSTRNRSFPDIITTRDNVNTGTINFHYPTNAPSGSIPKSYWLKGARASDAKDCHSIFQDCSQ